jgi:hypothetical protein
MAVRALFSFGVVEGGSRPSTVCEKCCLLIRIRTQQIGSKFSSNTANQTVISNVSTINRMPRATISITT